jgi:hypothetical protein
LKLKKNKIFSASLTQMMMMKKMEEEEEEKGKKLIFISVQVFC